MTDSILSTFTASDGDNIALQEWPLPDGVPLRGAVVLVHGLGEHAGRYDHVARRLNSWGFAVRGYDQYGHGESGGPRGGLPNDDRLLVDLADVVDATRIRLPDGVPLILLGHSMGGLVGRALCGAQAPPGGWPGVVFTRAGPGLGRGAKAASGHRAQNRTQPARGQRPER
jgi:alpha-beta hydrolase superfamily lysophospholipase